MLISLYIFVVALSLTIKNFSTIYTKRNIFICSSTENIDTMYVLCVISMSDITRCIFYKELINCYLYQLFILDKFLHALYNRVKDFKRKLHFIIKPIPKCSIFSILILHFRLTLLCRKGFKEMANVAYIRVSTVEQNEDRQLENLKQYQIDRFFQRKYLEKIQSVLSFKKCSGTFERAIQSI